MREPAALPVTGEILLHFLLQEQCRAQRVRRSLSCCCFADVSRVQHLTQGQRWTAMRAARARALALALAAAAAAAVRGAGGQRRRQGGAAGSCADRQRDGPPDCPGCACGSPAAGGQGRAAGSRVLAAEGTAQRLAPRASQWKLADRPAMAVSEPRYSINLNRQA